MAISAIFAAGGDSAGGGVKPEINFPNAAPVAPGQARGDDVW